MPSKPLILIDGSSYLHRAFHALPPLMTTKGQPTGAIYGVINMIRKLISEYDPELIAVVFDAKSKTERHKIFPGYKAHRPPLPEDLVSQIKPLHQIIIAMGLPLVIIEGIEADDIIGTLANLAAKENIPTLISTGDKDMAQLVDEQTTLINTMNNVKLDVPGVINKFGVRPNQIIDYLSLIGDSSDNIPGVPMVGPKTAAKLLNDYGTLDNLISHANEIKGKVGENLRATIPNLDLTKRLITIQKDLDLNLNLHNLKRQAPNSEKLVELFNTLEFKTWVATLNGELKSLGKHQEADNSDYKIILTAEDFNAWLIKLKNATAFAIDLETTSLDIMQAEIIGISFAITPHEAIYIPMAHDYLGAPTQLNRDFVLEKLKPILENPKIIKLGQNIKYDISVLANYNITLCGALYDTLLESYILNSAKNQHDKKSLALEQLGLTIASYEDLVGKGAKQISFSQINIEQAAHYAAFDADFVLQVHQKLWEQIAHVPALVRLFENIEMPLIPVLAKMERAGVCIDINLLQKQSKELDMRLQTLENKVYQEAGEVFNLNSPSQLQEILFNKLNLPIIKKTPKGQPSTAEDVLQELALDYELPKIILEYRTLSKLKSTYTDALPLQINAKTGRIHTSYNQAVTATGRLSSTNPNLQNIPARTQEGRKIREAFIAPPGYQLISADYSQIELRIMAHLSKDPGLVKAFANDDDIHKATAAEIFNVPLEKVTILQRQQAKTINFGLIYGMSAFGLAKRLGLKREAAENYIVTYFARYPGVKLYMEEMRNKAKKDGFVETIFGRRNFVPDINSSNFQRRAAGERAAINAPMQGSAADIIKIAMINMNHFFEENQVNGQMIMQVHDELVFEVAQNEALQLIPIIKKIMQEAATLDVPILVHCGVGDNWEKTH